MRKIIDIISKGDIVIHDIAIPRSTIIGVFAVICMYLGVAGLLSVSAPLRPTGDSIQHLNYAWRLSSGEIPTRMGGITYQPFIDLSGEKQSQASAHPPLFYMFHAPVVAPFMNSGQWEKAMMSGRAINLIFGVLAILALSWAGWVFGRSRRALFAVAVPAMSVLVYRFTRLNLDYALDSLLVVFTTLSLVLTYKILTEGVSKKKIGWITLISVLGMSTKAPFIIFLAISLAAIPLSCLLHGKTNQKAKIMKGVLISFFLMFTVAIAIGWFYYIWNYSAGGSWFTARPPDFTGGRTPQSFSDVMTNQKLWGLFYADYSRYLAISVSIISFSLAGYLTNSIGEVKRFFRDRNSIVMAGLLVLSVLGTFATQIEHAVGVGSINFRYMLPAIVAFGVFLSYGLLSFRLVRGQLVVIAAIVLGWSSMYARSKGSIESLITETTANKFPVPSLTVYMFIALFIIGSVLLSIALFRLTNRPNTN